MPVIRGTRLATSFVANLAAHGERSTLQEDYELSDAEIGAAVGYEDDVAKAIAAA